MVEASLIIVFLAGVVSFLSPCVLPLIPGFLSYLAGSGAQTRKDTFLVSVFYVLGFTAVFAALGILLNTVLIDVSYTVQTWLSRVAGAIIIIFGLHLSGLMTIPFLARTHEIEVKKFKSRYLTSFLFGAAFAVGWTPCVGAVLGSILAIAATQAGQAFTLLVAYSLGLGIPFLLVGLFSAEALKFIRKFSGFLKYFNLVVGILLIIIGILVFTQTLNLVANFGFVNNLLL